MHLGRKKPQWNNNNNNNNNNSEKVLVTHRWRTLENSASYVLPYLNKPNMKVLDVGCGPGSITIDIAKHVLPNGGYVLGTDYVQDPLKDAEKLLAATPELHRFPPGSIEFQVADVFALPFADDSFDLVHVHQVLEHIGDPVAGLREMRRVVKPNGGIVACREWASTSFYPDDNQGLKDWLELFFRAIAAKGGHPGSGRIMHVWAEEAGFELTKVKRSAGTWCFSTPEEREYFGGSMAARMRDSGGFARFVIDEGLSTPESLEAIASGWDKYVEDDHGWLGFLHGEMLCWK